MADVDRLNRLKAAMEEAYDIGNMEYVKTLHEEIKKLQVGIPEVPIQPVPQDAQYPAEYIPPENLDPEKFSYAQRFGTPPAEAYKTGGLLPIATKMNVDPTTGQMTNAGEYRPAVPDIVHSGVSAATLPGRAMRGEVDMGTEQGGEEAFNLAQWITLGMGGGVRPTVAAPPKGGVGPVQPGPMGAPNLIPEAIRPARPEPPRLTPQELRNQNAKWNRVNEINQLKANEGLTREQVMRNEMANLLKTRPGMFNQAEQKLMRGFIKGDKIDALLANISSKKPTLGAKQIWEVAKWGGLTGSLAQSSQVLGYTGMLAAVRAAAGMAGKTGVLAAKGAKKLKTASDIRKIKKTIAGKQKLPLSEPAEPITPKYRPEAPAKISQPKPEPEPETPTAAMRRYFAEEEARPINPSGKIELKIGDRTKKQGSLAPKPKKAEQVKGPLAPKSGEAQTKPSLSELRRRAREREVDKELARGNELPKTELKQTSPLPKKTDDAVTRAIREFQEQQEKKKAKLGGAPRTPKKGRGSY